MGRPAQRLRRIVVSAQQYSGCDLGTIRLPLQCGVWYNGPCQKLPSCKVEVSHFMNSFYRTLIALVGFSIVLTAAARADIGQIKNVSGEVFLLRQAVQLPAKPGDLVQQSDVLITGANGAVGVTFIDSSRLSAGPNSRVELKLFRSDPTTHDGVFLPDAQRGTLAAVSV